MSISEWLSFISDNELKAELIKEYVKNDWVTGQNQPYVSTNLEEADLSFAHLEGADLTRARLVNATLENAHLGTYTDTFSRGDCTRSGGGLLGLHWHNPDKTPSRDEIDNWTLTHPTRKDHIPTTHKLFPATNLTDADLTGIIGMTDSQIKFACLCNTLLPSDITNAKTMGDRDCDKCRSSASATSASGTTGAADSADLPTPVSSLKECWSHKDICHTLDLPYQENCMEYDEFAVGHAGIKEYCGTKGLSVFFSCKSDQKTRCRDDAVEEYIGCLSTHSHAHASFLA